MIVPYLVARINNVPLDALAALTASQEVEAAAVAIVALRRRLADMQADVCDTLFRLASTDEVRYRELIDLKRRIFKGADLGDMLARHASLLARYPDLYDWHRAAAALVERERAFESLFAQTLEDGRRAARVLARAPNFLTALGFTRGQVLDAARAYADGIAVTDKKALNDEETIIRYLTRAIVKVSPFSSFTSVGFVPLRSGGEGGDTLVSSGGLADCFGLDRSAILKLFERFVLKHHRHWRYRLTSNAHVVDGTDYAYLFTDRAEVYPYRTGFAKSVLRDRSLYAAADSSDWLDWSTLEARLGQQVDKPALLARLVGAGVLHYAPRLDDQRRDMLADFLALAEDLAARDAAVLPALAPLRGIAGAFAALGRTEPAGWPALQDQIHQGFHALAEHLDCPLVKATGMLYHDSFIPALSPLRQEPIARFATQLHEFIAHYLGPNFNTGFSDQLLQRVRAAMAGREPLSVFAFHELVQRELAATTDDPSKSSQMRPVIDLFDEIWARRGEDEIELAAAPPAEGARSMAFAAYGHVQDGTFILNNIDSGFLRCYSRFFTFTEDPAVLEECRAAYEGYLEHAYDFHDTCGFNTGRRPRICARRVWLQPAAEQAPDDVLLADLRVDWPTAAAYPRLLDGRSGRPAPLRHTGLFVKELYPRILELLLRLNMADEPSYFAFRFALHKMLADAGLDEMVRIPRIRYRDLVLSRAQWWIPREQLPQRRASESTLQFFRRLDDWRRAHGLPQQAFVRRHTDKPLERDISNMKKPLFIDFSSPLMIRMIGRVFSTDFDVLSLEEMLPDQQHAFASDGARRYASEILFEHASTESFRRNT
ncbi:lantibiotic dehydratase [Massilia consociata]|uniref:Lantibiotic dehydratase n=1 Tax=Massilia consociata TaxID=760117 RepID=A0ABV6FFS1_9BURK